MANDKKTKKEDINALCQDLILGQIESFRSDFQAIQDHEPNKDIPYNKESYCHAFYRMIGLPVVSVDEKKFYNPGYLGTDTSIEELEHRDEIDKSQHFILLANENKRELTCQNNEWLFKTEETKLEYMLDMMVSPIQIKPLDENLNDPFQIDNNQTYTDQNRTGAKSKTITKILRPFKCSSPLVKYVTPSSRSLAAPFIMDKVAIINGKPLSRTYLEFIARMRFSTDISRIDGAYNETAISIFGNIEELDALQKLMIMLLKYLMNIHM